MREVMLVFEHDMGSTVLWREKNPFGFVPQQAVVIDHLWSARDGKKYKLFILHQERLVTADDDCVGAFDTDG